MAPMLQLLDCCVFLFMYNMASCKIGQAKLFMHYFLSHILRIPTSQSVLICRSPLHCAYMTACVFGMFNCPLGINFDVSLIFNKRGWQKAKISLSPSFSVYCFDKLLIFQPLSAAQQVAIKSRSYQQHQLLQLMRGEIICVRDSN